MTEDGRPVTFHITVVKDRRTSQILPMAYFFTGGSIEVAWDSNSFIPAIQWLEQQGRKAVRKKPQKKDIPRTSYKKTHND